MHEKRCDIKQFRLGHTCHFKPLFYLYEGGRSGCMIQYHVHIYYKPCQQCSLCGPDLFGNAPCVVQLLVHLSEYKLK